MDEQTPLQSLYVKYLQQPFGYPLRTPEPHTGLPSSYEENGLQIGDVGYVDSDGVFNVLLNICFPQEHELHQGNPDLSGLVGLAGHNQVRSIPEAFASHHVISNGIGASYDENLKDGRSTACSYISSSTSGAILILPSGATRHYLPDSEEKKIRKVAEKQALDWCQFADRNSLYLITGFYKTNFWYLASFPVARSSDVSPVGKVVLKYRDTTAYNWMTNCDHRQCPQGNRKENQTVFISGFVIEVRHTHVWVGKISTRPRSILSELIFRAGAFLGLLASFWSQIASIVTKLWGHAAHDDMDTEVHVNPVPALSHPFHPSDSINRYLLDKNPNVEIAITHDNEWLNMIKKKEFTFNEMMEEGQFQEFLRENYTDDLSSDNVVCLRRINDELDDDNDTGLRESPLSTKRFFIPRTSIRAQQLVITCMRVESIVPFRRYMPVGFYVLIEFNGTRRRCKCKEARLPDVHNSLIEWDDEIMLPEDPTIKIHFSVFATFEFEPILGKGEMLYMIEVRAGELSEGGSTQVLASRWRGEGIPSYSSLLITLEKRKFDPLSELGCSNSNSEYLVSSCIEGEVTDKGHCALLEYHRGGGIAKLEECLECFKRALDICSPNHECHAAALFNHATAMFMRCQVHGTLPELDVVIASYRKALRSRPGRHPDRSRTLLYLAQALLYRQGGRHCEASVAGEIEELMAEIGQLCSEGSYERRAVDLIAQTFKRHQVLASGKLAELDELLVELNRSICMPPDAHYDRPYRLMNLSAALCKRFELTGDLVYLTRSISVAEDAMQLVSDGDKPWILAYLGDEVCMCFVQSGDASTLDNTISIMENALKILPNDHIDRPWILACLGDALRVRFTVHGDTSDLDGSISTIENALKTLPEGHINRPWILACLGDALRVRFTVHSDTSNLDNSMSMIKEAAKLQSSHFKKSRVLVSLCAILHARLVLCGDVFDLDQSLFMVKDALEHTPSGHSDKPRMLAALGDVLCTCFSRNGNVSDLDDSISMIEDAAKLTPDGCYDKPRIFASLGDVLRVRFAQRGHLADLDKSVSILGDAMMLTPGTHFDKPRIDALLADALLVRFAQRGDIVDLERSISILEAALKLTSDGHAEKPWALSILGDALCLRFVQRGNGENRADLDSSIRMIEKATKLIPNNHVRRPWILARLGAALLVRFICNKFSDFRKSISITGSSIYLTPTPLLSRQDNPTSPSSAGLDNLEQAISLHRDAVTMLLDSSPQKAGCLTMLANSLLVRSWCLRNLASDLGKAVELFQEAIELLPDCHSDKPECLNGLAVSLRARFEHSKKPTDIEGSILRTKEVIKLTQDGHCHMPRYQENLISALRIHIQHFGPDIVFAGQTGVGKSSLINMIRGVPDYTEGAAKVSNNPQPCTERATAYPVSLGGLKCRLWDTRGLAKEVGMGDRRLNELPQLPQGNSPDHELREVLRGRTMLAKPILIWCIDATIGTPEQYQLFQMAFVHYCDKYAIPAIVFTRTPPAGETEWEKKCSDQLGELKLGEGFNVVDIPQLRVRTYRDASSEEYQEDVRALRNLIHVLVKYESITLERLYNVAP